MKNLSIEKPIQQVGEAIPMQQAETFVADYQTKFPSDVFAYEIGRDILDQILNQPGCKGIKFFNALNEFGEKTLVYIGLDQNANVLDKITVLNSDGTFETKEAIVADRVKVPWPKERIGGDDSEWGWIVD